MRRYKRIRRRVPIRKMRRTRRYRSYPLRSKRGEVKYLTLSATNQAIWANKFITAQSALPSANNMQTDIFKNFSSGAANGQIIGDSIFIKSIRFKAAVYMCPAIGDEMNTCLVRFIWHNSTVAAATAIPGFFYDATTMPIMQILNRQTFVIHKDTMVDLTSGYPVAQEAGIYGRGRIKVVTMNLPVNRRVTFKTIGVSTGLATVRNPFDVYSLAMIGGVPFQSSSALGNKQVACLDYSIRVYYTDK